MKQVIWILTCLLSIAGYSDAKQDSGEFAATLPNGAAVELIGVSYRSGGSGLSQPKRWWRPDGADLPNEPYRHSRKSTGAPVGYYVRDFALRIAGVNDYSCVTYNSSGRSDVQPVIPLDEKNESVPGVLAFVCRFKDSQTVDTIRIWVSTEPWQKVEEWVDDAWQEHDHDNIVFPKSENPLILTWPRQKGRAVILEMVRADVDDVQAGRMLLFDRDDQIHEESPRIHGEGPGLIKEQYWFWNMRLEDMHRLEYQRRPYQWVEFRNVSLEPGRKTNVEIAVFAVKDKLARGLSVSEKDKESLGYILHRLAQNLRFPARGRATYQIEESDAGSQEPRLLRCDYVFDGVLYGFSVVETKPGDFNVQRYFDGEKMTRWEIRNNVVTLWKGRREMTPIYNLQQFFPSKTIKELLTHKVELKGSGDISGIPCSLLESVMSSKDRLKIWVTKEPDVYPLRIERYEHDNLRYVYEAERITSWNGVLFPKRTTISWYRSGDTLQHSLISRSVVSVESFAPNVEIAASEFAPEFPPDTSVNTYALPKQQASDFEPTRPAKRLRQFVDIDIEFNVEQAKGRMILICFWDMNQRPSRYCMRELAKRVDELKEKGVTTVTVQASKVDEDTLNEWAKKNHIPFPMGMIQQDEEQTRFNWGVKSLPWLILTDKEHVVAAEGFGLDELNSRIDEITSQIPATRKISGVVRDTTGDPLEGAEIRVVPAQPSLGRSNADGRFDLEYEPKKDAGPETDYYLSVRHEARNLVAHLLIDENTKSTDLRLNPAVTLKGAVVDTEGRSVANAEVRVLIRGANWKGSITYDTAQTDANGQFIFKAVSTELGISNVIVTAKGYCQHFVNRVHAHDAENNIKLKTITLHQANLSVSGVVVDVNDRPVSGATVRVLGGGEPRTDTITDTEGKFNVDKLGRGGIRIKARRSGDILLEGFVDSEAGATDVKVKLAEVYESPRLPKSIVGRSLPEFNNVKITFNTATLEETAILLCFFDMEQRPSRNCIMRLAKQAQELKAKGVVVVAVQASKIDEDTLSEWVKKYNIPFQVGMVQDGVEKIRFAWGVKSLPWLILTDKKYIVHAEGFTLSELSEKLKQMDGE